MSGRLVWDSIGSRLYETGVDRGVLYVKNNEGKYGAGVAWNGLTAVNQSPSGAESTPLYANNVKYLNLVSNEEFGCTIEAYTYPDEFAVCDGSAEIVAGLTIGQQHRSEFGFCYRTLIGNDIEGTAHGYKIHVVYNCQAAPSSKDNATVNESPEASTFSWEVTTTPEAVEGYKATAKVTIDSTKIDAAKLAVIEEKLYGGTAAATLPTIAELIELCKPAA